MELRLYVLGMEDKNPFAMLRQQAAAKLDRDIQDTREEYRLALFKINQLQTEIGN